MAGKYTAGEMSGGLNSTEGEMETQWQCPEDHQQRVRKSDLEAMMPAQKKRSPTSLVIGTK